MSGAGSLAAFADDPAAWADPAFAAPLIAPGLRPDTAMRLLRGRTASRASRLLADALGPVDAAALQPGDEALLLATPARLEALAAACGCVWHGKRVRALVRREAIAQLIERFGAEARNAALRLPPAGGTDATDDLAADIAQAAAASIEAWVAALPPWAARRMALVRARATSVPSQAEARARLLRRLALEADG